VSAETLSIGVDLPAGRVDVPADWTRGDGSATVIVAHGAGAGREHPFLTGFAAALNEHGAATLLFDFPYRAAGRRMPGPAAHAIATWHAVAARAIELGDGAPWFAAGKSYGGRMASMAAADGDFSPAGLVYLGYPLHPPGRPEKLRAEHLPRVGAPQLFLSGTRDPFVDPHAQLEDAVASCRDARLEWVEGGDHSFAVAGRKRPPVEVGADTAARVLPFLRGRA
jgi:uncharacterized protein